MNLNNKIVLAGLAWTALVVGGLCWIDSAVPPGDAILAPPAAYCEHALVWVILITFMARHGPCLPARVAA